MIDPLVLQVPDRATDLAGTFDNAGVDEPLVITETDSLPAQPGQTITAQPGTRFVILELPDDVARAVGADGGDFDFTLSFSTRFAGPVTVKPMLTASVDHQGTRYYPPVFPCVTDFAAIPAVRLPSGFNDLRPALAPIVDPDGDPVTLTIGGVTQDEPVGGRGDGDSAPDAAAGSSADRVLLRAARVSAGDGRVYRLAFAGDDGRGGACTGVALVGVPHSPARPAVDSGDVHDAFGR